MELRLPNASERYDFQNEAQLRRDIEAFARKPLTLYSESGSTARFDGGDTPLEIYASGKLAIGFTRGAITLYEQDDTIEGGHLTFIGAPNGGGTPFSTWSNDNYSGGLRWFTGGIVYMQLQKGTSATTGRLAIGGRLDVADPDNGILVGADSSFSRIFMQAGSAFKSFKIGVQDTVSDSMQIFISTAGGADARALTYTELIRIQALGIRLAANLDFLTDNTYDVGTAGNRPRFVDSAQGYKVVGTQVVGPRVTGWQLPTGTLTKTTFDTATVTLPQLAQRVYAIISALKDSHGLVGA